MIQFIENYWQVLCALASSPFIVVCAVLLFAACKVADMPWAIESEEDE